MNPRRVRTFLGAIALLLTAGACTVISDRPLSDPKHARPDPLLVGKWQNTQGKDQSSGSIRFDRHGYGHWDERAADGHWTVGKDNAKFFVTRTANATYLNFTASDPTGQQPATRRKPAFQFMKYQVSADHRKLTFWTPKLAAFRQAVATGQLKGRIERTEIAPKKDGTRDDSLDGVVLQDSPEAIIHFMEAQPTKVVFDELQVLKRID